MGFLLGMRRVKRASNFKRTLKISTLLTALFLLRHYIVTSTIIIFTFISWNLRPINFVGHGNDGFNLHLDNLEIETGVNVTAYGMAQSWVRIVDETRQRGSGLSSLVLDPYGGIAVADETLTSATSKRSRRNPAVPDQLNPQVEQAYLKALTTIDMSRTLLNWGPTTNSSSPYLVPPIMHYIAIDMTPPYPAKWLAARASCVALHPTWTFMYWDTASATAFIQREHPTLLKQWQSYRVPIQRADTLRYLLLYTYGGTYLDMDLECKRPLDPFRKFEFIAPAAHPVGISNGFIMAAPTHPFLAQVVSQLPLFNLNFGFPYLTVMFSSGCMYISAQHVTSPLRNEHLKVLGGKRNRLSGRVETPLFRHLGASSWHEGDAKLFSVLGKAVQAIPIFGSESEKSSSSSSSA